jgi:hypothetical protein
MAMKKLVNSILALVVLLTFSAGCGGMVNKQTKVKCPKCGAVFTVDEGIRALDKGA